MIVDKLSERCGRLMVQVQHNPKTLPGVREIVHREQIKAEVHSPERYDDVVPWETG